MKKLKLIPFLNYDDINCNLREIFNPISNCLTIDEYDENKTCFKTSLCYVNLKLIKFDRNKISTLDKWFVELHNLSLKTRFKEYIFPTPFFDEQYLVDLICILLYILDQKISTKKEINIIFRNEMFTKYKNSLKNDLHRNLFYQILKNTNNSSEIFFDSNYDNKLPSDYERMLTPIEMISAHTNSNFFPVQNTNIEKWLYRKKISIYDFKFLKEDEINFYSKGCKRIKIYSYDLEPDFVFGFSDSNSCKIYICFYNNIDFQEKKNKHELFIWLNEGLSNNYLKHLKFSRSFPIYYQFGIQDILLLFEAWLLLKKSYNAYSRNLKENKLNEYVEFKLNYGEEIYWPFNSIPFTYYYFTYIYIFFFKTKSRLPNKRFLFSLNSTINTKEIHRVKFDKDLIKEFNFPIEFKIKTDPINCIDYGKLNYINRN
jgi:hypothetical protein